MSTDNRGFPTTFLLSCVIFACGPVPPGNTEHGRAGGPVVITDRHGERFDITHAVDKYGMVPSGFEGDARGYSIRQIVRHEIVNEAAVAYYRW